jgi:protein-tyrosine phosphatase
MYEIRDWLYVSNFLDATDPAQLKKRQIRALLTLHKEAKLSGVDVLFLPVIDGQPIAPKYFEQGMAFVRRHHTQQHPVLIACGAGISRSVTFTIAVLHEIEGLSLHDAFFNVRRRNPQALPDHIHWQSLTEYYHDSLDYWDLWSEIVDSD